MAVSEEQKRRDISEVQTFLRSISYYNQNIPRIIPDGIYGDETAEAVKAFQREYGLPVTGEVDFETWQTMYRVFLVAEAYYAELVKIAPFSERDLVLETGNKGYLIYLLQAMLNTISEFYDNIIPPEMNGVYDEKTAASIRQVQHITGMKPDGKTDRLTWNALALLYNIHSAEENKNRLVESQSENTVEKPEVRTVMARSERNVG